MYPSGESRWCRFAQLTEIRVIGDLNCSNGPKSCSTINTAVEELLTFLLAILCHREIILGEFFKFQDCLGSLAADDTPLRSSTDFPLNIERLTLTWELWLEEPRDCSNLIIPKGEWIGNEDIQRTLGENDLLSWRFCYLRNGKQDI